MFSSNKMNKYLILFGVVVISSYIANKFTNSFKNNDEYELIKKYLLNDSPLYGFNRPKIWIHSKYEINARKWKDFYSRNTTDLNQPYIHLTIKTIINHCGNDFNICLIDDETFSKLIPSWDINLSAVAEPMKSHYRELGMAQLIYYYGGMAIPNSFLCMKNLKTFYAEGTSGNKPFVCENINRGVNLLKHKNKLLFTPNTYIMGANKNDESIKELIEYLKMKNRNPHFTSETDFVGDTSTTLLDFVDKQKFNLIMGQTVGVKTQQRKAILLEDLMEEDYLDLSKEAVGIYIPADEILNRPKYQWFAVMSSEEVLQSNAILSKYLKASIVDGSNEYYTQSKNSVRTADESSNKLAVTYLDSNIHRYKSSEIRSVVSI